MAKESLVEIKKGQTGRGLLVENDGYISIHSKENKGLFESLKLNEGIEGREIPSPFIVSAVFQKFGIENANGRIYPEAILKSAVEKYMPAIQERRAYGECYTPDAMCLTKNGWKPISEVNEGDEVLTLNTKTNEIEVQKVTYKTACDWNGELINIKGNHIDDTVTPNHGFPIYDCNHKFKKFITAEEIFNTSNNEFSHFYIPKRGIWKGEEPENIVIDRLLPSEMPKNLKSDLKNIYSEDLIIPTDIFCAFMGVYLSEGCSNKKGGRVTIYQKKEEACDKITELLDRWGIAYHKYSKRGEKILFQINDMRLNKYCKQFGICYDKFIPNEIKVLSPKYLSIFYDWFLLGDGRIRGYKRNFSNDVFSTSKQLVLDLNEIQFKMGMSGTMYEEERQHDRVIEGRTIKGENAHNMFFTYLSTVMGIYADKRFINATKVPYNGKVYCIEVPNHCWYVMQNGKCHWTKNCNHPDSTSIDLGRIALNIIELHWEGHTLVGKMEIPISEGFRKLGIVSTCADMLAQWIISGLKVGVSSRGLGNVIQQAGHLVVDDSYEIVCWDAVSQPSTPNAWIDENPENLRPYVESEKKEGTVIKEDKFSKFDSWLLKG